MRTLLRVASLVLALLLLQSCKTRPLGPYVSPRIEGVVVAADTGEPVSRVEVMRGRAETDRSLETPKGGEMMMRKPPVLTAADGSFVLAGERVLSVIRGAGWNQVRLTFSHSGYIKVQTNYSLIAVTNGVSGKPILDIGKVRIAPG